MLHISFVTERNKNDVYFQSNTNDKKWYNTGEFAAFEYRSLIIFHLYLVVHLFLSFFFKAHKTMQHTADIDQSHMGVNSVLI